MNPVTLLMQGRKLKARKLARHDCPFDLAWEAKVWEFDNLTRWQIARYLKGWCSWKELEPMLQRPAR
jgi:hypothetical protein